MYSDIRNLVTLNEHGNWTTLESPTAETSYGFSRVSGFKRILKNAIIFWLIHTAQDIINQLLNT